MEKLNIAIFGADGAIGNALCAKYLEDIRVKKIFTFSRKKLEHNKKIINYILTDYEDEENIDRLSKTLEENLDIILIAIGSLIEPEKSLKDIDVDKFLRMIKSNTIPTLMIGKYFLPKLHRDRVVKFASLSARVGSISDNILGGWHSYRSSKTALNMLLKNFAIEQKRYNPQSIIIGLHPGTVDTKLSKPFQKTNKTYFTPPYAASKLFDVIETKNPNDTGKIFAWDNTEIYP